MPWSPWVEILWLWALVSQAVKWGVYLFLSLLGALDQMGHLKNVAWCLAHRCSQTSGINIGRSSKNEHLYHNSLSARVCLGGSGPWHQWRAVWRCNPGLFLFVPGPPFTCSVLVNLLPSLFVLMGDCHPCDTAKECWVERNKAVTVSLYGLLTFLNKPKLH